MEKTIYARKLRNQQTPHESKLWRILRAHRFAGYKFRRQYPIGPYIVDFCCPRRRLVIELDGGGHNYTDQRQVDDARDQFLYHRGFRVFRVWNNELDANSEGVQQQLFDLLQAHSPSPGSDLHRTHPLPRWGEGAG